jgi:hypothetical protein
MAKKVMTLKLFVVVFPTFHFKKFSPPYFSYATSYCTADHHFAFVGRLTSTQPSVDLPSILSFAKNLKLSV